MHITVNVQLSEGDVMEETPDEIADRLLQVFGGDESKDFVQVHIQQPIMSGTVGTIGSPLAPEESE